MNSRARCAIWHDPLGRIRNQLPQSRSIGSRNMLKGRVLARVESSDLRGLLTLCERALFTASTLMAPFRSIPLLICTALFSTRDAD
jgi:hypothetical protein